jgi:hypothetical protein
MERLTQKAQVMVEAVAAAVAQAQTEDGKIRQRWAAWPARAAMGGQMAARVKIQVVLGPQLAETAAMAAQVAGLTAAPPRSAVPVEQIIQPGQHRQR